MDFARQLKDRIDIVAVIGERVRLQKAGVAFKARCPFHNEKTPSFNVNPSKQLFKCFGCGKGGSVIDFAMEIDGLTFWEACVQLAERHGVPLPKRTDRPDEETRRRAGAFEAQEIAFRAFRASLAGPGGAEAREYLKRRGVSAQHAEEFGLGLAEPGGQTMVRLLERAGIAPESMEQTGLVAKRQEGAGFYDRFRGRIVFPIHDETGKLVGFGGRAFEAGVEPKYLNSPETAIYRKSHLLYNLHRARKAIRQTEASILVEGYMDVIGLHSQGIGNAVASCGTALTFTQARMLKRHSDHVVVNFDADAAGVNAAERSIQVLLEEGLGIRVLELAGGLDPDEYIREHGREGYETALGSAPRYFYWLADRARAKFDMTSAEGRVEGLRFLTPSIQRISDRLERAAIANDVASYLAVDAGMVLDQFRKTSGLQREDSGTKVETLEERVPPTEKLLIQCLLRSEEARRELGERVRTLISGQTLRVGRIAEAILAAGEPPDWAAAEGRLDSEDRNLLSVLLFADQEKDNLEEECLAQAEACLRRLGEISHEGRVVHLKARIREAERGGNLAEAIQLNQELANLGRRVAPGRVL